VSIGPVRLEELQKGTVRHLTLAEKSSLDRAFARAVGPDVKNRRTR
jgi:hypothetical protein